MRRGSSRGVLEGENGDCRWWRGRSAARGSAAARGPSKSIGSLRGAEVDVAVPPRHLVIVVVSVIFHIVVGLGWDLDDVVVLNVVVIVVVVVTAILGLVVDEPGGGGCPLAFRGNVVVARGLGGSRSGQCGILLLLLLLLLVVVVFVDADDDLVHPPLLPAARADLSRLPHPPGRPLLHHRHRRHRHHRHRLSSTSGIVDATINHRHDEDGPVRERDVHLLPPTPHHVGDGGASEPPVGPVPGAAIAVATVQFHLDGIARTDPPAPFPFIDVPERGSNATWQKGASILVPSYTLAPPASPS